MNCHSHNYGLYGNYYRGQKRKDYVCFFWWREHSPEIFRRAGEGLLNVVNPDLYYISSFP